MKLSIKSGILLIEDINNRGEIIINTDNAIYLDIPESQVNLDGLEVIAYSNTVEEIFKKAGVKT